MLVYNARVQPPPPQNERVLDYAPGSPERHALKNALLRLGSETVEIPLVIGGRHVETGDVGQVRAPHAHERVLANFHKGTRTHVDDAVDSAKGAWPPWARMNWESRAAIFLRAAELLSGKYRMTVNAATMLGQSKTAHQAEIDAACELADFWRWNVHYAGELYAQQPASARGAWNGVELRPLEGFIFAASPFNFTSIAGNLPTAPAIMGNTVVWKPAAASIFSSWFLMQILEEAGLPPGVINMVSGNAEMIGQAALRHRFLAGVHFTGSTKVFVEMWKTVAEGVGGYLSFPRLIGETGGKNFIIAHPSADPDALVTAIVRGAFEYQGQKCSAASRVYIAESMWEKMGDRLVDIVRALPMGDVADFKNFMGAVIDGQAFGRLAGAISSCAVAKDVKFLAGGECDRSEGWFIRPTVIRVDTPKHFLMTEELFGPIVGVFIFPDDDYETMLRVCNDTSMYALTGAIFATDRVAINKAHDILRHAAGNFYINDKPTGAVVGQQPFGGARASGTNDKAGSPFNLMRWVSPRTIKENLAPPTSIAYPFMGEG